MKRHFFKYSLLNSELNFLPYRWLRFFITLFYILFIGGNIIMSMWNQFFNMKHTLHRFVPTCKLGCGGARPSRAARSVGDDDGEGRRRTGYRASRTVWRPSAWPSVCPCVRWPVGRQKLATDPVPVELLDRFANCSSRRFLGAGSQIGTGRIAGKYGFKVKLIVFG